MASPSAPPCPHELRPGTAVCLRCQHAERAAQRARQRKMIARGAAATMLLGVIAAVGIAGASALRARGGELPARGDVLRTTSSGLDTSTSSAADDSTEATPTIRPELAESAPRPQPTPPPVVASITPRLASAATVATSRDVPPLVPVGRSALRDTMVADRAGDTVRVSFDLMFSRTRRPDKFEAIVRSTLPQVYGAPADSALRALPVGAVARAGDLVTTLSERGFRIPLTDGRSIAVWPETRVGRDGPLVVAYRAVVSR